MKKLMPKPKGFTIIEVIIVLVVGAVIMLAVFLVVPQLQQSARNNRRKDAARSVWTATNQIFSQGGVLLNCPTGAIPGNGAPVLYSKLNCNYTNVLSASQLKSPSTGDYTVQYTTGTGNTYKEHISVRIDGKCSTDGTGAVAGTGVAVVVSLEPYNVSIDGGTTITNSQPNKRFCVSDSN